MFLGAYRKLFTRLYQCPNDLPRKKARATPSAHSRPRPADLRKSALSLNRLVVELQCCLDGAALCVESIALFDIALSHDLCIDRIVRCFEISDVLSNCSLHSTVSPNAKRWQLCNYKTLKIPFLSFSPAKKRRRKLSLPSLRLSGHNRASIWFNSVTIWFSATEVG